MQHGDIELRHGDDLRRALAATSSEAEAACGARGSPGGRQGHADPDWTGAAHGRDLRAHGVVDGGIGGQS